MLKDATGEDEEFLAQTLTEAEATLRDVEAKLSELLSPRDPRDDRPVIIEIRSGAGGDEAALFAGGTLLDVHALRAREPRSCALRTSPSAPWLSPGRFQESGLRRQRRRRLPGVALRERRPPRAARTRRRRRKVAFTRRWRRSRCWRKPDELQVDVIKISDIEWERVAGAARGVSTSTRRRVLSASGTSRAAWK